MLLNLPTTLPRAREVLSARESIAAHSVDSAEATISELFCAHELSALGDQPLRMMLRSAHTGDVGIELLDYGSTVSISPVGLESFHLVQIPLTGRATMTVGSVEVLSDSSTASLPPLDRSFSMVWEAGTPQLIVYVQREALARSAAALYGATEVDGISLAPRMSLETTQGRAFLRAVFELHDTLEVPGGSSSYAQRLSGEMVMARLLTAVDSTAGRSLSSWEIPALPATASLALVRRYRELLDAHSGEELGVLDLAEALGVPLRTLQDTLRRETGSTPSRLLLEARLRRANEMLSSADPSKASVTGIAEQCGFSHLGRFAAAYRGRFGEGPSTTLRA